MTHLDGIFRESAGRIRSRLIRRFNDTEMAEDALSEAWLRAVKSWEVVPKNPSGWLYRVAVYAAVDSLRKARTSTTTERGFAAIAAPVTEEEQAADQVDFQDRLGLLFMCCHPALGLDARIALTLRLVCDLSVDDIASAFSVPSSAIAQRLVRAKRKINQANIVIGIPQKERWPERVEAVLSVIEVVFARLNESAEDFRATRLTLEDVEVLCRHLLATMPEFPSVSATTATILYCKARRPARLDCAGLMVPIDQQDPELWDRSLIAEAEAILRYSIRSGLVGARTIEAAIHSAWCSRAHKTDPVPWAEILQLYDNLLQFRDDPVVRLNRCLALCHVRGSTIALVDFYEIGKTNWSGTRGFHAMGAYLEAEAGNLKKSIQHVDHILGDPLLLSPEREWLLARKNTLMRSSSER